MDKIKIEGIHPTYDGEHELDLSYFTNRELHMIKKLTGVRPGEIQDALEAGDNDLVIAFTIIALRRAGKQINEDTLWDAPVGKIVFIVDEAEEDEASPPVETPSDSERSATEKSDSSGKISRATSDPAANGQSRTGEPGSVTASTLARTISQA